MMKEEAMAKKAASKEKLGIELSTSPFEQKFADLRPVQDSSASSPPAQSTHHHPHTPRGSRDTKENPRPREPRLKASTIVKRELSEIFEDVYDAWMFIDLKRSLEVHPSLLVKGLERLGIIVDTRELVHELDKDVYDGNISVREFIKGLAWHELPSGANATYQLNSILDEAMKRQSATIDTALRKAAHRNSRISARSPSSSPNASSISRSRLREGVAGECCSMTRMARFCGRDI